MALFVLSSGCSTIYVRINSDPPGAHIFWGPSKEEIGETPYTTPYARANTAVGPAWREFYYQLKKPGYRDSEIIFEAEARNRDRNIFVKLEPSSETITVPRDDRVDSPKPTRPTSAPDIASATGPPSTSPTSHPMTSPPGKESPAPAFTSIPFVGERWALIVGISSYQDSRIPSLRYGIRDAKAFHDWLVSSSGGRYAPSRVRLLLGQDAIAKNIKDALYNWLRGALAEDQVVIYFAGHGSPDSPDSPNNLFLLPYDTQYDDIATTGFPMWDIETALKRFIKAKRVVVIADACHSGGVGEGFDVARREGRGLKVNPIGSGLQGLSGVGEGVCVISASDDRQFSQEGQHWGGGHGVFTFFLLQGLNGEADYSKDGKVSLGELIPYLSEQVRRATKNSQSPTVAGKFDPALTIGK